jgi:membrane protein
MVLGERSLGSDLEKVSGLSVPVSEWTAFRSGQSPIFFRGCSCPAFRTRWKLGKRVVRLSQQHDIMGRAAQLGYFFLLALFPALLSLTGLVRMLPIQPILPRLMEYLQKVLPQESLV